MARRINDVFSLRENVFLFTHLVRYINVLKRNVFQLENINFSFSYFHIICCLIIFYLLIFSKILIDVLLLFHRIRMSSEVQFFYSNIFKN